MFIKIIIAIVVFVTLTFFFTWLETYVISKDTQRRYLYDIQHKVDDIWKFTFGIAAEPAHEEQQQMRQACRRILSHRVDDIQYKKRRDAVEKPFENTIKAFKDALGETKDESKEV